MPAELYWVEGPWPGKLALAPRPRGGDWLEDEILGWKRAGVDTVLSLLTPVEEQDLGLDEESRSVREQGLDFTSFPIPDRQVPTSEQQVKTTLDKLNRRLSAGHTALVHCRQGVGRTGLIAACLLVKNGMSPGAAVETISAARGVKVPETDEQREWIERFAPALMK